MFVPNAVRGWQRICSYQAGESRTRKSLGENDIKYPNCGTDVVVCKLIFGRCLILSDHYRKENGKKRRLLLM